jgi:hypothetical protein
LNVFVRTVDQSVFREVVIKKVADSIKILASSEIMPRRRASRQCHRYPPIMKLRSTPTAYPFGAARVTDAEAAQKGVGV